MDIEPELQISSVYPEVYKLEIEQCSFEEILHLYAEEILQNAHSSKVDLAIINYITNVIEPVGWEAVWRATQESFSLPVECDFVVEVADVSLVKPEADIIIKSLIIHETHQLDPEIAKNQFQAILNKIPQTVPLVELYPISEGDDEELYAKTALAIEYMRFFYKNLCRPWDGEEEDVTYTVKLLRPRLQLYFDIQNKVLPDSMISKIKLILRDGWKIIQDLNRLYSEMNVSDSETELNEDDVLKSLELRKKLDEIQREMEILEDPVIRTLVMKKYVPHKSPQKQPHQSGPLTYLVAKQFTFDMIKKLSLAPATVLQFDQSPDSALSSCSSGDTILIFPGCYRCDSLGWLDEEVTVKGVGPYGSVKIEATGNSDVFLSCDSPSLTLCNLTLKSIQGVVSTVIVHHGKVHFKECVVDSDGAETAVTILGGAEAIMDDSEICNSNGDGIQLRPSAILTLNSCKIISCGGHGLQLEGDETQQDRFTELNMFNTFIVNNDGCGIFVNSSASEYPQTEGVDFSEYFAPLNVLPWLKYKIEDSVVDHNKQDEIGIWSNAKCNDVASKPLKPAKHYGNFNAPDRTLVRQYFMGYPVLDKILNEDVISSVKDCNISESD